MVGGHRCTCPKCKFEACKLCETIAMDVKCLEGEDNMIRECHANAKAYTYKTHQVREFIIDYRYNNETRYSYELQRFQSMSLHAKFWFAYHLTLIVCFHYRRIRWVNKQKHMVKRVCHVKRWPWMWNAKMGKTFQCTNILQAQLNKVGAT